MREEDGAAVHIAVEEGGTVDDIVGKSGDCHRIHDEAADEEKVGVTEDGVHLVVHEEVEVGSQRQSKHEQTQNDHLRPGETVDVDLCDMVRAGQPSDESWSGRTMQCSPHARGSPDCNRSRD